MTHAYRLPRAIADRLTTALQGRKNAPAALALAEWLARFWSAPRRLLYSFPVDRRAIAGREDLGLSEARVRGAIATLVEVGFVTRYEPDPGKRYQRTEGGLQRRPILFRFGEEYGVEFAKANARAQAARGASAPARRVVAPPQSFSGALLRPAPSGAKERNLDGRPSRRSAGSGGPMPVLASPGATAAHILLAQKQSPSGSGFLMGEKRQPDPTSPLEMALERLRRGVRA